jgi:hypothetical protein
MQKNSKAISVALIAIGFLVVVFSCVIAPHGVSIFQLPKDEIALSDYQATSLWIDGFSAAGLALFVAGGVIFLRSLKTQQADSAK